MAEPELLILDEPFDGLDVHSRQQLAELLAQLNADGYTVVLVLNRFDEIPAFVQHAGVLVDCMLTETGEKIRAVATGTHRPTGAQRETCRDRITRAGCAACPQHTSAGRAADRAQGWGGLLQRPRDYQPAFMDGESR